MQYALLTPMGAVVVEVKRYRVHSLTRRLWVLVVTDAPSMYWAPASSLRVVPNT